MSAPCCRRAPPSSIHADNQAESAGPAGLDAGDGVFDHDGPGGHTERLRGLEERVRCGFSGKLQLGRDQAVDPRVEQVEDPRRPRTCSQLLLDDTTAVRSPDLAKLAHEGDRSGVGFDLARGRSPP